MIMDKVDGLIEQLSDKDWGVRLDAASEMGKLGVTDEQFDRIIELTRGNDDERDGAALALMNLADPRAVPDLVELLDDDVGTVKGTAVQALGAIGKHPDITDEVLEKIAGMLIDDDSNVRGFATQALGRLGNRNYFGHVIIMLEDREDDEGLCLDGAVCARVAIVQQLIQATFTLDEYGRDGALEALRRIADGCDNFDDAVELERLMEGALKVLQGNNVENELAMSLEITFLKLLAEASKKKNDLSQKKGLALAEKPRPPKLKRKMWQAAMRRNRNG